MMKINCYANFGELAHEKLPVYATVKGEVSEQVTLIVPDGVTVSENEAGQKLVEMPGSKYTYLLSEVLTNDKNGDPCLKYVDDNGHRKMISLDIEK